MYFCGRKTGKAGPLSFQNLKDMYLKGIFIIVAFLVLGNLCSWATGHFVPGSVFGMVLLFAALLTKIVRPEDVRPVADFLTKNMSLFFVPASIGIMEQWGIISTNLLGWVAVVFISTFLVLISVGSTQSGLMSLLKRRKGNGK